MMSTSRAQFRGAPSPFATRVAFVIALCAVLAATWGRAESPQSDTRTVAVTIVNDDVEREQRARALLRWCRSGAFLDAIRLMNSAMRAHDALRQSGNTNTNATSVAQAELGSVLAVAIKQAREEYHCVQGTLALGYDVSYAETVKRAALVAQAMRLSPSVIATALELAAEFANAPR